MKYLEIIAKTVPKQWTILMHYNLSRLRITSIGAYLNYLPIKMCVPSID